MKEADRAGRPIAEDLATIRGKGLHRELVTVEGSQGPRVRMDGREKILLASNNFLGLAGDRRLAEATARAAREHGVGSGASRLISGTMELHERLEARLARFLRSESAILFNTGYMANLALLTALTGPGDTIFSDALNHASLIDGCRLSRAAVEVFPHCDTDALEQRLREASPAGRRLIVTDGVFSVDGDTAPLARLVELARRYEALLLVDEAHAVGVFGPGGRGLLEALHLEGEADLVMGTLGKALGGFGAFAATATQIRELLVNRARPFIFSTALPPPVPAAALAALEIVESEPWRRERLWENVRYLRDALEALGFHGLRGETHIIPVLIGENDRAVQMRDALAEAGVLVGAIRPPTVPDGTARLRITPMATHTREDLDEAVKAFETVGRTLRLI